MLIDRDHPRQSQIGPITVDISQLTSDSRRRDNAIRMMSTREVAAQKGKRRKASVS
jgi:hypothetical protein